jgi:hypothetical protein
VAWYVVAAALVSLIATLTLRSPYRPVAPEPRVTPPAVAAPDATSA